MNKLLIRFFDLFFSVFGLLVLLPLLFFISILILFDSRGGVFYLQSRVGWRNRDFRIWKFRTMYPDSEKKGLITLGDKDERITRTGIFLRRYKLDELPQLLNVLNGSMSFVGPRPEVRKYVDMYTAEQRKVLNIKPGITDFASIEYANENELLSHSSDPMKTYIEEVMPAKILLNMKFISNPSLVNYFTVIFKTAGKIFRK